MSLTAAVFLLAYIGAILGSLIRHPVIGLYAYVLVFYLDAPNRWWGAGLPGLRWSFLLAIVTLIGIAIHRRKLTAETQIFQTPYVLLIIYVVWMWAQLGWAVDSEAHALGLNYFTKYLIVIYLIIRLIDTAPRILNFMLVNAAGAFYLGYLAWQSGGGGRLDGIGGPGINDANSLGMQMAVVAFFCAVLYLSVTDHRRWFAALAGAFIMNTIVLSGSRGAFLAVVAGGLMFFWFRPARQLPRIVLLATLGLLAFGYVASDYFWERMTSIKDAAAQTDEIDKSAASRLVIINAQFQISKSYPLGGGHQTTAALSEQYIPIEYHAVQGGRSSHNTFMSALVDQGIPGLILWLFILYTLLRRNRYVRLYANRTQDTQLGWVNSGLAAGIAVVSVAGMFAPYIKTEIYVWLLALTCCVYSIVKVNEASNQS